MAAKTVNKKTKATSTTPPKTKRKYTKRPKIEETWVCFVVDKSGSMSDKVNDVVGGFNKYLQDLRVDKNAKSKVSLSMTQFDTGFSIDYQNLELEKVQDLTPETYRPGGGTALYDAVGKTIKETTDKWLALPKNKRPNVLTVVFTDGEENSSKEYSLPAIKSAIESAQKSGWTFIYLGASADAWKAGGAMGIMQSNVATYDVNFTGGSISNVLYAATTGSMYSGEALKTRGLNAVLSDEHKEALVSCNVNFNVAPPVGNSNGTK